MWQQEKSPMGEAGRCNRRALVGEGLASLLLLISAIWLPRATYRSATLTVTFKGGRLGLVLIACGIASLGLAALSLIWDGAGVSWLQLLLGCTALVCSLVLPLTSIAEANLTANAHVGYSDTSYGIGAGLAIAASVVLLVSSIARLRSGRDGDHPDTRQSAQAGSIR
jgi:polyferredoxin